MGVAVCDRDRRDNIGLGADQRVQLDEVPGVLIVRVLRREVAVEVLRSEPRGIDRERALNGAERRRAGFDQRMQRKRVCPTVESGTRTLEAGGPTPPLPTPARLDGVTHQARTRSAPLRLPASIFRA